MYVFSDMLGECTLHMMFSHASCVHTHVTPLNKRSPCQPMHSPPPFDRLVPAAPREHQAYEPQTRASIFQVSGRHLFTGRSCTRERMRASLCAQTGMYARVRVARDSSSEKDAIQ